MTFQIVHNDISKMNSDAIVNAANKELRQGSGVCGAIFAAANDPGLKNECHMLAPCKVGEAVITKGYNLKAKNIIHAVGPVWYGGNDNEELHLRNAYRNSLELAKENDCKSISFPLISSGVYGYPKEKALNIAVSTIKEFIMTNEMEVNLVVFDKKAVMLGEELRKDLTHYIDRYYNQWAEYSYDSPSMEIELDEDIEDTESIMVGEGIELYESSGRTLLEKINNLGENFRETLFRLIDEKGFTDVEVYKRANMDRKLFSKIRKGNGCRPKKQMVIALAISLRLSLDEAKDLLEKAGYSLTNSRRADVIITYFLEQENYDIFIINEALFALGERTL